MKKRRLLSTVSCILVFILMFTSTVNGSELDGFRDDYSSECELDCCSEECSDEDCDCEDGHCDCGCEEGDCDCENGHCDCGCEDDDCDCTSDNVETDDDFEESESIIDYSDEDFIDEDYYDSESEDVINYRDDVGDIHFDDSGDYYDNEWQHVPDDLEPLPLDEIEDDFSDEVIDDALIDDALIEDEFDVEEDSETNGIYVEDTILASIDTSVYEEAVSEGLTVPFKSISTSKQSSKKKTIDSTSLIVLPVNPSAGEIFAANLIQKYIYDLDNSELQIVYDSEEISTNYEIYIGDTVNRPHADLTGKPDGSYVIKTFNNNSISIYGTGSRGTVTAAYAFLEKFGGYRYYCSEEGYKTTSVTHVKIPGKTNPIFDS